MEVAEPQDYFVYKRCHSMEGKALLCVTSMQWSGKRGGKSRATNPFPFNKKEWKTKSHMSWNVKNDSYQAASSREKYISAGVRCSVAYIRAGKGCLSTLGTLQCNTSSSSLCPGSNWQQQCWARRLPEVLLRCASVCSALPCQVWKLEKILWVCQHVYLHGASPLSQQASFQSVRMNN